MRSQYIKSTTPSMPGKKEISYYDESYIKVNFDKEFYGKKSEEEIALYREIIEKKLGIEFTPNESKMLNSMIKRMDDVTICHSIENAMLINETYSDFKEKFPQTSYSKEVLMKAALFHDVGKIASPPEVLKSGVWLERKETIEGVDGTFIRGTKPEMNIHSDSASIVFKLLDPTFSNNNFYFGDNEIEHTQIMGLIENHHIFTTLYGKDVDRDNNQKGIYNEALVYFASIDSIQAQLTDARGYKGPTTINKTFSNFTSEIEDSSLLKTYQPEILKQIDKFKEFLSIEHLTKFKEELIDVTIRENEAILDRIIEDREREYIIEELLIRKFIYDNAIIDIDKENQTEHIYLIYEALEIEKNLDKLFLENPKSAFAEILRIKDLEKSENIEIKYGFDFSKGNCMEIVDDKKEKLTLDNLQEIPTIKILDWGGREKSTITISQAKKELIELRKVLSKNENTINIAD